MALGGAPVPQALQHRRGQLQQAQLVGHSGLALANAPGGLLLGEVVGGDELVQGQGLLPEVQVPALEVLYQGQQGGPLAVDLEGEAGDLGEPGQLGRPQAALPSHQLPAALPTAHGEGLEQAQGADGGGQLLQLVLGKDPPGLIRVGSDGVHGEKQHPVAVQHPLFAQQLHNKTSYVKIWNLLIYSLPYNGKEKGEAGRETPNFSREILTGLDGENGKMG